MRPTTDPGPRLRGRQTECQALDGLLSSVRAGTSAVLVVRGEAGAGKTALLDYLVAQADGCRIARAAGVESEMELAFAGLHQICAPFLPRLDRLPGPQRDALATTFGLGVGPAPDRFLVGLAVLTLLSNAAAEQPLVCVVDDAHWLDRASSQVLGFVARRLAAESVALAFTIRELEDDRNLAGLPDLTLGPLRDADARAVLAAAVPGRLDVLVRDRIVVEARGNPLALLELPRAWTPAAFAGGFGLPDGVSVSGRIEESFRRRLMPLPEDSRRLLLVAAAESVGDPARIWRAAERLGIGTEAASAAVMTGLIDGESTLRFRHPLVRSVVYEDALPGERRLVHEALAEVTDPVVDADRRVWHRAHAAPGPDEEVAFQLERSAALAGQRGGLAAAAAFLGVASDLTLDPASRAERALAAAEATHLAGTPDVAQRWLAVVESGPPDALRRARSDLLRAQIAFTVNRGFEAPALLLQAARQFESLDPLRARETYLDALTAAQFTGVLAPGQQREIAESALAAPPSAVPGALDLLLDGHATLVTQGEAAGVPILRRAVAAFRREDAAVSLGYRWLPLAISAAIECWDLDGWAVLSKRQVRMVRDVGALTLLPIALSSAAYVAVFTGDLAAASSVTHDIATIGDAIGGRLAPYAALLVATWQGRGEAVSSIGEAILDVAVPRGEGVGVTTTHWAKSVYANSVGRYEDALAEAEPVAGLPVGLSRPTGWAWSEMIEAAVRVGRPQLAEDAFERLSQAARATGTDWALGLEARSRALLTEGDEAEGLYAEAVERLDRAGLRGEHGRARLLYGEWLRRRGRRVDARTSLRTAHEIFEAIGAEAFAERARRELEATGETVRKRTVETFDELTPQEGQIARLAVVGRTNPEIGAELFLSPRTVEWHLRKVYAKVGVSSRRELRAALAGPTPDTTPVARPAGPARHQSPDQ